MKQISLDIKELIKGMLIVGTYFLLPNLLIMPFISLLGKNLSLGTEYLILNLILTSIFVLIYNKELFKDLKDFKKNYKKYLLTGIKYWLIGLFIMISSSIILKAIGIGNNVNQSNNQELLNNTPIQEIIDAILLAPIIEELVFRESFRKISKNIHIYSWFTGLFFGLIHVLSSLNKPIMLLYLIPFSAVGIAFGYAYKKSNNIYTTIVLHSLHNAITIIQMIILGGI